MLGGGDAPAPQRIGRGGRRRPRRAGGRRRSAALALPPPLAGVGGPARHDGQPARPVDGDDLGFALAALRNDLVGRGELADALRDWSRDPGTPLGRLLIERGALTPERHALVVALLR